MAPTDLPDTLRFSLLDRTRTRHGEPHADALEATLRRAEHADALGFHRFWTAEHHAVPGIASGSPPLLLAAAAARTQRIRLGSGGVMLPNHRPLVVAGQFAMLEALHPGRIDLGVGRSLGFTAPVREALGVAEYDTEAFARDITAVQDFLHGRGPVTALPVVQTPPPLFVLATGRGLEVAARAGLPVVVGGPRLLADPAPLDRYREQFQPSAAAPEPYVVVSLEVMIADSTAAARELLLPEAWAMAESRSTGAFGPLRSRQEIRAMTLRPQQLRRMDEWIAGTVHGDAERVAGELADLAGRTGASEIMASTSTYDRDDLARADSALAELLPG
ncbi:MsnO8 family LLM class oxidoreductase [Rhodococcus sp. IEGM 1408]|uniref:MsnO8 family LLM class oxidoreductase n=1 Tax=Rhodococcus sp. IEGM 1408 TaxID=3082220 RepID=UPI002953BA47|nr:MsnO8 family LLM class oxidoreductase [Rhodococcus sp. IEGM 1408]MDV8001676.1 MsnO8 family LLM class oxidoreductase [Rhodococcus sp. IEGM 1408]